MKWNLLSEQIPADINQLKAILLENRGIDDQGAFFQFQKPEDMTLEQAEIDPGQMKRAVKRIKLAIENQEKVVIFGDYDADGITAASILWLTLNELGLTATPFIPKRDEHGYGISTDVLKEIIESGKPDLIITVDNGIVAHEAVEFAKGEKIDVIVTDHHQPTDKLPPANAVVHSTLVAGASVAWFLARELAPAYATKLLDLVGLATVADQMPLLGLNRSLVTAGLSKLQQTARPGLKALYKVAGIEPEQITSMTIGYTIAPRINAVGRLAHGLTAMRLLCTQDLTSARGIAQKLDEINKERQDLTYDFYRQALTEAKKQEDQHIIVLSSDEYHEGIIGLIAGRLTEILHKPSVVISIDGKLAKGSARSIEGVNITHLLRKAKDYLIDVGGHELAAGFSAEVDQLDQLREKLFSLALEEIDEQELEPAQVIDCQLPLNLVSFETIKLIDKLEPFGMANLSPVFALNDVEVLEARTVGRDSKHLKLSIKTPEEGSWAALAWNRGKLVDQFKPGMNISLAAAIEINEWNGKKSIQFKIKDLKWPRSQASE